MSFTKGTILFLKWGNINQNQIRRYFPNKAGTFWKNQGHERKDLVSLKKIKIKNK